jgi:uncharacterized protein YeaO (DUF488 family)
VLEKAMIQVKRVYAPPERGDGDRYLVDRLWPRGVKKESLAIKAWLKDVAPSNELRNWYRHDPELWDEFRKRYFKELEKNPQSWERLLEAANKGTITLLYSSKYAEINNAVALREFLTVKIGRRSESRKKK